MNTNVKLKIPYGGGFLRFSLPSDRLLGILKNRCAARKNIKSMLAESLGSKSKKKLLKKLSADKKNILIVVPDATRKAHLKDLLPCLLKMLGEKGCVSDVIIATGLHKRHDKRQIEALLGKTILAQCRILNHGQDKTSLMNRSSTSRGIPIILNKNLTNYDFIISIGVVEPHLLAGYSGGAKTVAIGLAGEDTINATHSIEFLDHPLTKIGSISHNPFQETLWEIAKAVRIGFAINVVNDCEGSTAAIFSGNLKKVFCDAVRFSKGIFESEVKKEADIVICGIGHPKDINLYQASRAVNYILNVDRPILKKGGVLIVAAQLGEGTGDGISEKRFYKELRNMASPRDFIRRTRQAGCVAGVHRAYMVARPLLDYKIVFVSVGDKAFMRGLPFVYFDSIRDALLYSDKIAGENSKIYVVPRALSTIARRC